MSKIFIKGVLIGGIVDVLSSIILGLPFAIYAMQKTDLSHVSEAQASAAVTTTIHANVPLYLGQLFVGLACSVLGGYVAARMAKNSERLNGTLSSYLCTIMGIYVIASGKDTSSLWLQLIMLVASPAMALIGGDLVRRSRLRIQGA